MKKLICAALAVVMTMGMAITAHADVASDPKVTLKMAEVNPLDTIVGQTDSFFAEKVEELSGGSMIVL